MVRGHRRALEACLLQSRALRPRPTIGTGWQDSEGPAWREKGPEVGGSVSTTWWLSLTMHSHSMPYCHRYPSICHCD